MDNYSDICSALKKLRLQACLTQQQAAEMVGLAQSHLSMIENGRRRITASLAKRLLELYGVKLTAMSNEESSASDRLSSALNALRQLACAGGTELEEAADRYVCLCVYLLLRKLYLANPHNTDRLFSLGDEQADRLAETLIKEPDRLLSFARHAEDIQDDRIEPPISEALALREVINSCEELAVNTLGL